MNEARAERMRTLAKAASNATGDERARLIEAIHHELDVDLMELQGILFASSLPSQETEE